MSLAGSRALASRALSNGVAAACLFVLLFAWFWPGIADPDTVDQYQQALSGVYGDWHPPIMARLWALFLAMGLDGTGPMLALQLGVFWLGLGLVSAALARQGRPAWAAIVLAIGLLPPVFGWMTVIYKDMQLTACLTAAAGLVGFYRLQRLPVPIVVALIAALLIAYALFVRVNAVFAILPLLVMVSNTRRQAAIGVLLAVAAVLLSPLVNHRILGAQAEHPEQSQMIFDMAGIAHHAGLDSMPGLKPELWKRAEAKGCYRPFYWDSYWESSQCDFVAEAFQGRLPGFGDWIGQIFRHPLPYAAHRLRHWNATLRFIVGAGEPRAFAGPASPPNAYGIGATGGVQYRLLRAVERRTPFGLPALWLALALGMIPMVRSLGDRPEAAVAGALLASAIVQEGSFLFVSVASDLRYHHWPIVAVAMAVAILGSTGAISRRQLVLPMALVGTVLLIAAVSRLLLPVDWPPA